LAEDEGFVQMSQSTFFNLASQFDIPLDILNLLETSTESSTLTREETLQEMQNIRLQEAYSLRKKKGSHSRKHSKALAATQPRQELTLIK